jgi:hypothetical protein
MLDQLEATGRVTRAPWEQMWADDLSVRTEEELRAATAVLRTIAGVLEQVGVPRTSNGVLSP